MAELPTIQLKEFCKLFRFEDRQVRFVLEQGFVPRGVAQSPATGNRREFGPDHAFWLAIVLHLKQNGVKTPAAAEIAELAGEGVRYIAQTLGGDRTYWPAGGWLATDHQYYLDVGDRRFIRIETDACPSDILNQFGWRDMKRGRLAPADLQPLVVLRLDLTAISKVLSKVEGWKCPYSSEFSIPLERSIISRLEYKPTVGLYYVPPPGFAGENLDPPIRPAVCDGRNRSTSFGS